MDKNSIQVGAIGFLIKLEIRKAYEIEDLSTATTLLIKIQKPDDTVLTVSGTLLTDGTDGLVFYRTVEGDLDQAGTYHAQAYIVKPDFTGFSSPEPFTVYANLPV